LPLTSHGTLYKVALWRTRTKCEVFCSSGRNGSFKMHPKETGCVNWIHLAQDLVNGGPNIITNLQVSRKVGNFWVIRSATLLALLKKIFNKCRKRVLPELREVKRIFTLENVIQCRQALFCVVVLTVFIGATSVVGIATLYRLHGPGIESRWVGPKFCVPVQTGSGVHSASYSRGTGCFPGVK